MKKILERIIEKIYLESTFKNWGGLKNTGFLWFKSSYVKNLTNYEKTKNFIKLNIETLKKFSLGIIIIYTLLLFFLFPILGIIENLISKDFISKNNFVQINYPIIANCYSDKICSKKITNLDLHIESQAIIINDISLNYYKEYFKNNESDLIKYKNSDGKILMIKRYVKND